MALSMYGQDADIVYAFAGGSGLGVLKAAADKDLYAIGVDVNQNPLDPDHIVLSSRRKLDTVIFDTIKSLQSGTFESGTHALGLKEGAVDYTLEGSNVKVPQPVVDKVEQMKAKVVSGAWTIPDKLEDVDAFVTSIKGQ
jgi:basic membrane protein A